MLSYPTHRDACLDDDCATVSEEGFQQPNPKHNADVPRLVSRLSTPRRAATGDCLGQIMFRTNISSPMPMPVDEGVELNGPLTAFSGLSSLTTGVSCRPGSAGFGPAHVGYARNRTP